MYSSCTVPLTRCILVLETMIFWRVMILLSWRWQILSPSQMQYGRPVFQEQQLNIESWAAVCFIRFKTLKKFPQKSEIFCIYFRIACSKSLLLIQEVKRLLWQKIKQNYFSIHHFWKKQEFRPFATLHYIKKKFVNPCKLQNSF